MRILSSLLFATALFAAEQPAPLLSAALPDVQRSFARFQDSIYGTLWNDPQMAPLREKLLSAINGDAEELGFKISEALLGSRNAGFRLHGFASPHGNAKVRLPFENGNRNADPLPLFDFSCDLGALAEAVFNATQQATKLAEPVPVAGADAAFAVNDKVSFVIARFGQVLAGATMGTIPTAWAPAPDEADFALDFDSRKLMEALVAAAPPGKQDELASFMAVMDPYLGLSTYRSQITKQGLLERYTTANPCLWLVPVDRALIDRLPATSMNALAVGLDGKQLWAAFQQPLLAAIAKERGCDEQQALAYLDEQLLDAEMTVTFTELIEGLTGTFALAIAPGAPFPSITLSIPRTPALDAVVLTLLGFAETDAPVEGTSTIIPIPNLPLPLTLARDAGAWMITSDVMHANDWLAKTGGFLASPAATLAAEHGGAGAVVFGCSDTPVLLRTIIPYLAMGLGQADGLEPDQRQAILQLLQTAAAKVGTGYVVAKPDQGGLALEMRGLLTYSITPALFAALAMPNLMINSVAADEAAAPTALKSGVFPAQIQFQAGGYIDDNGNGIGDFGFFSEMSGAKVGENGLTLALLPAEWNEPTPLIHGYRFAIFLPDDRGGAVDSPDGRRTVKGPAETYFIAYAWPDEEGNGRQMFAITQAGTVFSSAWDGQPPAWNALWGGGSSTWTDEPAWQPYRR